MATMVLVAGNYEPEPNENELKRGFEELSQYLEQHRTPENVQDVGKGVIAIGERQFSRGLGNIASSPFIMPKRTQPRQVSSGVYTL